jgi:dienelactone hydrolase
MLRGSGRETRREDAMLRTLTLAAAAAAAATAAAALVATIARAQAPADLPIRTELHPIQSLWITDQQFLTGDRNGKQVTVSAELSIPRGTGKLPAVILMHGSGGMGGNIGYWKRQLNAIGVATFAIDGMTGRGLTGVGSNQAVLGRLNFIVDIYRSLAILAKHPRIDPDRIVLMGFSRGGQAALYASLERFNKIWNESGAQFAAYIPFYPDCATSYLLDTDVMRNPIRIFHGTPDDYNPVRSCKAYRARLGEKADIEITEYPSAPHGFDNPLGANPSRPAANDQSVRECTIAETAPGVLTNAATGQPFTYKDDCVRLGPTVGHDPEATVAVTQAVRNFLKEVLRL